MTDEPMQNEPGAQGPEVIDAAPPPVKHRPRFYGGWIAGLTMLGLSIMAAVAGYAGRFGAPPEPSTGLEEELRIYVSLSSERFPSLKRMIEGEKEKGLRETAKEALKTAAHSDESARVAVVAAYEAGDEPPEVAITRLAESEEGVSRQMAEIYGGTAVSQELVEEFGEHESDDFSVRLAQVHAREMLDLPSGREEVVEPEFAVRTIALSFLLLGVITLGIVCFLIFFGLAVGRRLSPVGFGLFTKHDGDRYMVRFSLYMVAFLLLSLAVGAIEDKALFDSLRSSWFQALALLSVLLVTVALLYPRTLGKSDSLGQVVGEKRPFIKLVGVGVFGYLCTVPVLAVVLVVIGLLSKVLPEPTHPIVSEFAAASGSDWLALALTAAVFAPLLEEIAFRGLLLPALASQVSKPIYAVLACGFLFAAIHPQGPLVWPALMTTGAAAAYLRYYSGSLVPSFVLHMVHNGAIFLTAYLLA